MTKAKTRAEFIEAWESEFLQLNNLAWSLPVDQVRPYFAKLDELKTFISIAAFELFPKTKEEKKVEKVK